MPDTEEYRELLHKVFPHLGENCRIETPFSGVRTANVKFGRNVIVMPGCLMISAGALPSVRMLWSEPAVLSCMM